jgi:hypothetical protein
LYRCRQKIAYSLYSEDFATFEKDSVLSANGCHGLFSHQCVAYKNPGPKKNGVRGEKGIENKTPGPKRLRGHHEPGKEKTLGRPFP